MISSNLTFSHYSMEKMKTNHTSLTNFDQFTIHFINGDAQKRTQKNKKRLETINLFQPLICFEFCGIIFFQRNFSIF